ncbi:MAG: amidohydrolase [Gammaproteobacteria bacterium]|nr:amidohydrolase [Gammaproteobacteria bacterium]
MNKKTTIYSARKILTMSPSQPTATHVAVRNGRILGAGSQQELKGWGDYSLDDRFRDKIIMPGFVEGHSHTLDGVFWAYHYVGYFDRIGPDGTHWPGLKSIDEVVASLQRIATTSGPGEAMIAWGFDPIYFSSRRMLCTDLDQVVKDRPLVVMHASGHMLNANSYVLQQAGITADTNVEGVIKDESGQPSGELQEIAAMFAAFEMIGVHPFHEMGSEASLRRFGAVAQLTGVTTATDLYSILHDENLETMSRVTAEEDYPIRLVTAYGALGTGIEQAVELLNKAREHNTGKIRHGIIKMMTDGSIQGFTARLNPPGYFNGAPNGIWNAPPAELTRQFIDYHKAGFQIHVHTNGDEAVDLMLGAIEKALAESPCPDHRHTLQHAQMISEAQLQRTARLGVCVNMFANHIFYWGEQHYAITMGPERAQRIEPFASAERLGIPYAMHSDAPVTPINPLFTAWCAITRQTAEGRVLGENERISVDQALRSITLGAAFTLKMDHEIGSIEAGKFADFCVLDEDPTQVNVDAIKDIPVHATVLGGRVLEV